MQVLPVVERELRVAARQPRTWWRRVLVLAIGLLVFGFVYLVVSQWASVSRAGSEIFAGLAGLGLIYALLAGPLATVDCISRERRDGTLGLLFLTNLRSYDVVLGKVVAASFDMVLGLIAVLPLLALPLLLGGITLAQFARLVLALSNVTFLSLALGVGLSALVINARASLALLAGAIVLLTFGPPFLIEDIFNVSHTSTAAAFGNMACPLYTFELCLAPPLRWSPWKFSLNMGGLQSLAWLCLGVACLRTANSWRDLPASAFAGRWRERLESWKRGGARARLQWRRLMLDKNPIQWLEGRDRLQERILWALFLGITILFAVKHLHAPETWPGYDVIILWPWWAHCVLCLWIALQAPRRLADDKQSGALELLLCTSLSTRSIIQGNTRALLRRYGRVFFGLLALDGFVLYACFSNNGGWTRFRDHESFQLGLWALLVFPLQAYSIARLGLLHGLTQNNSLRASFVAVWKVGVLPWILFFLFILSFDLASRRFKSLRISDTLAYAAWAGAHVIPCTIFLLRANRCLKREFRLLALNSARVKWWQRLLRRRQFAEPPSPVFINKPVS